MCNNRFDEPYETRETCKYCGDIYTNMPCCICDKTFDEVGLEPPKMYETRECNNLKRIILQEARKGRSVEEAKNYIRGSTRFERFLKQPRVYKSSFPPTHYIRGGDIWFSEVTAIYYEADTEKRVWWSTGRDSIPFSPKTTIMYER